MTTPQRPTASTINDEQLDDLYDLLDYLTGCLASTYELTGEEVLTAAREAIDADRTRAARASGPATAQTTEPRPFIDRPFRSHRPKPETADRD